MASLVYERENCFAGPHLEPSSIKTCIRPGPWHFPLSEATVCSGEPRSICQANILTNVFASTKKGDSNQLVLNFVILEVPPQSDQLTIENWSSAHNQKIRATQILVLYNKIAVFDCRNESASVT